jgi:serine/threonine protein kinase
VVVCTSIYNIRILVHFIRPLGTGSYSSVYLAEAGNEKFAVKVMDYSKNRQSRAIAQNEEMIERSIRCSSPYLIRYIKTFESKSRKFIVMEYCEREDLQALINTCLLNHIIISEEVCF